MIAFQTSLNLSYFPRTYSYVGSDALAALAKTLCYSSFSSSFRPCAHDNVYSSCPSYDAFSSSSHLSYSDGAACLNFGAGAYVLASL